MRRTLTTASLIGILSLASLPAKADVAWLGIGSRFHVGDVHFSLVFGHPGYSYPRGLYYRTAQPFHLHGVHCASTCFRSGPTYYHSQSCPLVRSHFVRLGIDPYDIYARYAPRGYYDGNYGGRGYGYNSRYDGGYDRYQRYDGYQSYGRGDSYNYNGRGTRGSYVPRYDMRYDRRYDNRGYGSYDGRGRGNYHQDRRNGRNRHYDGDYCPRR